MSSTQQTNVEGIVLERVSEFRTRLTYGNLDAASDRALRLLKRASVGTRCGWATEEEWEELFTSGPALGLENRRSLILRGPITAVARFLRRQLQPERSQLAELRVVGGVIHECQQATYDVSEDEEAPKRSSSWRPAIQ